MVFCFCERIQGAWRGNRTVLFVHGKEDVRRGVASVAAIVHEATLIEKHLTLRRADATFSLLPQEMKQLVIETARAWQALVSVTYGSSDAEEGSKTYRRALYIAEDISKGNILTPENLRIVRPGLGLPPKYYDLVLGCKATRDVKKGTPASWDLII